MILIFSEAIDLSTNEVIDWLIYYDKPFFRINSIDISTEYTFQFDISDNSILLFDTNKTKVDFQDITSVWYRKQEFKNNKIFESDEKHSLLINKIDFAIYNEFRDIRNGMYSLLESKFVLGNFIGNLNKIKQLQVALKCGLNIPETRITTKKEDIIKFKEKCNDIICKPISNIQFFEINKINYTPYTFKVDNDFINQLESEFFPSLFQQYIEKEFEIRAFLLEDKFYSMAIFSQSNNRTEVDFRKYDHDNPNRNIPFKLPETIENKLLYFAKEFKLNTGSFDLIYSKTGEYYFLEVNPVGLFAQVSTPCNYYLEKKVAETLIKYTYGI